MESSLSDVTVTSLEVVGSLVELIGAIWKSPEIYIKVNLLQLLDVRGRGVYEAECSLVGDVH